MKKTKQKQPLLNAPWGLPAPQGLYDPTHEHDACGVGFVARENGQADHGILQDALKALTRLSHRGAVDADEQTGDGAGVLTQIPKKFLAREIAKFSPQTYAEGDVALATVFFPRQDVEARDRGRRIIEHCVQEFGMQIIGWRHVPVDLEVLGEKARHYCPDIKHLLVARAPILSHEKFEKNIYLSRKEAERRFKVAGLCDIYFPSFSTKTVVYKGLLMAAQVQPFYLDLKDPLYETASAVFHQRYSTNTFPTWALAHPFRMLAHNGEINTIAGNRNWMRARLASQKLPRWRGKAMQFDSVVQEGGSDSMSLDNVAESLVIAGRDIGHAMMMLIPEPWQHSTDQKSEARDFYEFHSCLNEPWDGPAAVIFSDGRYTGGIMDRNGLRPMRFKRHQDGRVVCASELGVLEWSDEEVIEKGRIGPGRMLVVDGQAGKLLRNLEMKQQYFRLQPYGAWIKKHMVFLGGRDSWPVSGATRTAGLSDEPPHYLEVKPLSKKSQDPTIELRRQQIAFGFTKEEIDLVIKPMAQEAKEPLGSMGDDAPLGVFSEKPQHLSRFFKQRFAQVTNPPIDSIREAKMMTLNTYIGERGNIFDEQQEHAHLLRVPTSMFGENDLAELLKVRDKAFQAVRLKALFRAKGGAAAFEAAVNRLMRQAHKAVSRGAKVVILSDRGVSERYAPVPMLLAVSAVHHHLIRTGLRLSASIICETGDVWEVHHVATLIGYGASVVVPYLALHTIKQLCEDGSILEKDWHVACARYHYAMDTGILKVMSKMGISTLSSYRGAQVFDALGLNQGLIESFFPGTGSKISGMGLANIADDVLQRHHNAFGIKDVENILQLPAGGNYRYRRGEEQHAFDPMLVKLIHKACGEKDAAAYQEFSKLVHGRAPLALRDLLQIPKKFDRPLTELTQVEAVEEIYKRFGTSAMSVGALSKESHEQLAVAMNRIGGRSNSGEGGEDPARYHKPSQGDWANSTTKQVASGRFGVTPDYLLSAREIQIKMAQGSKPGEGGQLPGHKVSPFIAQLRFSNVGVPLISPPPHHDIYSIEDLAQ